jgi:hypothetical protein
LGESQTNGLSENGVTVSWDNLTTFEGGPDVLGDLLIRGIFTDLGSHLLGPSEDFLVGETTKTSAVRLKTLVNAAANPWRGPARPFKAAEYDKNGSERADPTK